jgi:hypothetical protein
MKRITLLLTLTAIFVSCRPPAKLTPAQTPTSGNNVIQTVTNSNSLDTLEPSHNGFEHMSISSQNVQVLAGDIDFRLLVKVSEYRIGRFNLTNQMVENEESLPETFIDYPVVSDNGFMMAYINIQQNQKELVVRSLALTNEETSIALPKESVLATWVSSSKIAIWGGSPEWQCLRLLLLYDISIAEVSYPKFPAPDYDKSDCVQLPLISSDGTKEIYPWHIFDFENGTSSNGFPFMMNTLKTPSTYSLTGKGNNISIAYVNDNQLSYVLNVPITTMGQVSKPETIELLGLATKNGWWQPITWWPDQTKLGMDLIDQNTDPLEFLVSNQQVPTKFYLIDFGAHKIVDYELDRGLFFEKALPQRIYKGFPSPDGKFFAWTIYDGSTGLPIGSKVLELSSGFILSIPELDILGWAVAQ